MTTAKQIFELQESLRDAEQSLNELAIQESYAQRAGAFISSGDYLRSPEGRAVEALRNQVEALQSEVGGVVYRVPGENLGVLVEKLDKLVKRAEKKGLGSISYRLAETERVERELKGDQADPLLQMVELGYVPRYAKSYTYVVLHAEVLKLGAWMLLATLTVEPGGVMISKVPGFARAWALVREGKQEQAPNEFNDEVAKAAQVTLDALDLGAYRDPEAATRCDHCNKSRQRTKTYLVEHAETGEIKQVGANCVRDFLGIDPAQVARYAQFLSELEDAMDEDEECGGSGSGRVFITEEYLTHVCALIRTEGWVGRSDYNGLPTANAAYDNIVNYGKIERGVPQFVHVTEEDHERAVAAIAWAKDVLGAKVHQTQNATDFEHNMYVAANGYTVPKKGDGVLAYVPIAHAKYEEREIQRKLREERKAEVAATSKHVGQVKDRIVVTGTVASVFEKPGDWGTTFITKIEGDDGNLYTWFGSYDLGRGNKVTGKFTVKKHDEFQGVKQTVITRPSGVEVVS